ncbi:isochorismatase family protein [Gimesia aquarii]|uniref:Trehalose utilization n=1 Tax=Gimesia aquarii TaxID=2527964 RepID=A0A517W327_9PLAN|nr:isochorismatase family protein [Gimesia aquarii]QDT99672.1 Trehalose utilization [Gimesia aquarii]
MNVLQKLAICLSLVLVSTTSLSAEDLKLQLRYQQETSKDSGRYHRLHRSESWKPQETAIIVCDVWDYHHCFNAVKRLEEFAPRLDNLLKTARDQGVTIIHAPSDCMDAYKGHPARMRAMQAPKSKVHPEGIKNWCSRIPSEERAVYPVDQSDGGEDDDPEEHAAWAKKLASLGRNPAGPWKSQSALITIDGNKDFISDKGDEVWNILNSRGINNVILTGVHTNMCVLGRPFGLRQMAKNGKNVVLVRDMTDTMYNPKSWPYVSHFTGNDLIISHIEKFICPTITSDQFLGGKSFVFKKDHRPHLVIVMAEAEYDTKKTLPEFAGKHLGKHFRVSYVFADDKDRNSIPGIEVINEADVVLFSVRRRVLPEKAMQAIRKYVKAGKPVVGIRTASHAFSLRGKKPPAGLYDWPEFDAEVFGGNYHGHLANDLKSIISINESQKQNPILTGIPDKPFQQAYSLYEVSPLAKNTTVLMTGKAKGFPVEPVAWTFKRKDGGKSFYTSLGHPGDFKNPEFVRLLANGVYWAAGLNPADVSVSEKVTLHEAPHWSVVQIPNSEKSNDTNQSRWYRCVVRVPEKWMSNQPLTLKVGEAEGTQVNAWLNGTALKKTDAGFQIVPKAVTPNDANLIVLQVTGQTKNADFRSVPQLVSATGNLSLAGRWQYRRGNNSQFANMPLPAKFGTVTDIVFKP